MSINHKSGHKKLLLVSGKIMKPKINHYVSSRIRLFASFWKTLWAWTQKGGEKVRDLKWDECTHNPFQKYQLVYLPITVSRGFLQPPLSLVHAQGLTLKVLGPYSKVGPQHLNSWHGPKSRDLSGGSRYQQWIQNELSKSVYTNNYNTDCSRWKLSLYGMLKISN